MALNIMPKHMFGAFSSAAHIWGVLTKIQICIRSSPPCSTLASVANLFLASVKPFTPLQRYNIFVQNHSCTVIIGLTFQLTATRFNGEEGTTPSFVITSANASHLPLFNVSMVQLFAPSVTLHACEMALSFNYKSRWCYI